jgi:hypothetical protein
LKSVQYARSDKGERMFRTLLAACLVALSSNAFATWKVETGKKALSSFPPLVGTLATVPAKAPFKGMTARLQLECFTHPELSGLQFGIILSKAPPNGLMAWRYQYDDSARVETKPYSRTLPPQSITVGDASSPEVKGLTGAKRLRLTLLPADGSELPYEFDVTGAADAIKAVGCKEMNKLR